MPAELTDLGSGVFRIRWGRPPNDSYVIIDTKLQAVLYDSAPKELIDVPDPPQYLELEQEYE